MAEGITGLNPTEAQERIMECYDTAMGAYKIFMFGFSNFMFEVEKLWYSPKALEFGDTYADFALEIGNEYNTVIQTIIKNSVASYNLLASSNGLGSIDKDGFMNNNIYSCNNGLDYVLETSHFKEAGPSGEVGMNIFLVKGQATILYDKFDQFIAKLSEMPLDIAFYDPDGELKARFKDLINKFCEFFEERSQVFKNAIDSALTTEIDNITIAKEAATETLNA